jgi:hypothetical protein
MSLVGRLSTAHAPGRLLCVHMRCMGSLGRHATTKAKGISFEQRVVRHFKRQGEFNVRRSVFLKDSHGNRSEIDVVYGALWWKRYVECKNYKKGFSVPLEVRGWPPFPDWCGKRPLGLVGSYLFPPLCALC